MRAICIAILLLSGCASQAYRSVPSSVAEPIAAKATQGDAGCTPKAGRTECWYVVDTPDRFDTGTISVASVDGRPPEIVQVGHKSAGGAGLTRRDKRDLRWFAVEAGADVATTLACGIEGNPLIRALLGKHPAAIGLIAIKGGLLAYQRHQLAQWDDADSARVVRWTHAVGIGVVAWNLLACF